MKYFIVGLHASGKQEVLDILAEQGVPVGKLFSNIDEPTKEVYNSMNYELYTMTDVNQVFENNAYIFIHELQMLLDCSCKSYKFFEGLSKYTFDNNSVFALSPDQFISIAPTAIKEDICVIWLDNTKSDRFGRYRSENRYYDFVCRDNLEKRDINAFVKQIYTLSKSRVLYFTNEEPCRVASIVAAVYKHPDLLDDFIKNYN